MAPQVFNPNNPTTLGVEWFPIVEGSFPLNRDNAALAVQLKSTIAESIGDIACYLSDATDVGENSTVECTVMHASEAEVNPDQLTYGQTKINTPVYTPNYGGSLSTDGAGALYVYPDADFIGTDLTGTPTDAFPNYSNNVNNFLDNWSVGHYINFDKTNSEWAWVPPANITRRQMAGRRVMSVMIGAYARPGSAGSKLKPYLIINGDRYYSATSWSGQDEGTQQRLFAVWNRNPDTGRPWTTSDIDGLSAGLIVPGMKQTGLSTKADDEDKRGWRVYDSGVVVNFTAENRLAVGYLEDAELNAWNFIRTPTPDYFNMLHFEESTFEYPNPPQDSNAIGGWIAGSNTNISSENTHHHGGGSRSLRLRSQSVGPADISANTATGDEAIPVVPGLHYYISGWVLAETNFRNCFLSIVWKNASNGVISTTNGSASADSASWGQRLVDGVAPAGAAIMQIKSTFSSVAANNEDHFVDEMMVNARYQTSDQIQGEDSRGGYTKLPGDNLLVLFRRLTDGHGGPSINVMDSGSTVPMPAGQEISSYWPTLRSGGEITSLGDPQTFVFGLRQKYYVSPSSPPFVIYSADAFPYAKRTSMPVYAGVSQQQIITSPGTADYGFVKALLSFPTPHGTDESIDVKVRLKSTNAQVGTTATILASDIIGPNTRPQIVPVPFDANIPLSNAQFYIEFSSAALSEESGWRLTALDTVGGDNLITFGGVLDALMTTLIQDDDLDGATFLADVPDPVDSFSVTEIGLDLDGAQIDWTYTGTSTRFIAYVIYRSDGFNDDDKFYPIARITDYDVHEFNDFEARRNWTSTYKMRVERDDGALSLWSESHDSTPMLSTCAYQLTSNENPGYNQTHVDEPNRSYKFPDPLVEHELYGRDLAVVFRGSEDRGDSFVIDFWLYMDGQPYWNNVPTNLRGRQAFQSLIDIIRADLSYVCVLDQDGNRWFASLNMNSTKATRQEPGGKYLFPVSVREVTRTPSTPDVQP